MEMPDGFKRLKIAARNALEMSKVTEGRIALEFITMAEDINNTAMLMKEMAEALQFYAEGGHTEPFSNRLQNNFAEKYPGYVASVVLKNFKEWK